MDRFFKRNSSSEVAEAKEEVELLRQKVKTMGEVATTLEAQLDEEKTKYTVLMNKTTQWKEKVKALTESDRSRIAQLESELRVFQAVQEANGGKVTPEVQSAIQAALQSASASNAVETAKYKETIANFENTVVGKDAQIKELQQELETVKAVCLESQTRFAEEMQSVVQHHNAELSDLRSQLASLKEMDTLKLRLQEQKEEIASLENHSHQQTHIALALQQDLAAATEHNRELEQQLQSVRESLSALEQKQAVWKEKVVQMKAKDNETIKQLEAELAHSRESSVAHPQNAPVPTDVTAGQTATETLPTVTSADSAESRTSLSQSQDQLQQLQIQLEEERLTQRQFEEKLESWKQKAKQIRLQDAQTIQDLQQQCQQLQHQLTTRRERSQSANGASQTTREADVDCPLDSRVNMQLANVQSELDTALRSRDEMQAALQTHLDEEHSLTEQLTEKKHEFERLEAQLITWKEKAENTHATESERNNNLQEEVRHLREQLETAQQHAEEAAQQHAEQVQALHEQLEAAQQQAEEAAQQHAEQVQALHEQLEAAQQARETTAQQHAEQVQALHEQLVAAQQQAEEAAQQHAEQVQALHEQLETAQQHAE
ncbi:hypothetical protein NQL31_001643, partial [Lotmaria passim]